MPQASLATALTRATRSSALRAWLTANNAAVEALVYRTQRACVEPLQSYVYDSEGRRYRVSYVVVPVGLDGRTNVVPSHDPRQFAWNPGYPEGFQTRDLGALEETTKIRTMARNFEPYRLLGRHMDATLGPPIVWPDAAGRLFVLGGNGRTLAFLLTSEDQYADYLREGRARWPECWPHGPAPAGTRWLLVRVVHGLSQGQAVQLAAASQLSTSATEGRIGRALGIVRSLGLNADKLPLPYWTRPLSADTLSDFMSGGASNEDEAKREARAPANRRFRAAILSQMDRAKAARYEGDPEQVVDLLVSVMIGLLPKEIRRGNLLDNPKVEDALIGALPAILSTHGLALNESIRPEYDLYAVLPDAIMVFDTLNRRRLSFAKIRDLLDEERATGRIPGVRRVSDAPDLAIALAGALYAASRRTAPEVAVSDMLDAYVDAALRSGSPRQAGMFGGFGGARDYAQEAADDLAASIPGFMLPTRRAPEPTPEPEPEPAPSMFGGGPRLFG